MRRDAPCERRVCSRERAKAPAQVAVTWRSHRSREREALALLSGGSPPRALAISRARRVALAPPPPPSSPLLSPRRVSRFSQVTVTWWLHGGCMARLDVRLALLAVLVDGAAAEQREVDLGVGMIWRVRSVGRQQQLTSNRHTYAEQREVNLGVDMTSRVRIVGARTNNERVTAIYVRSSAR